MLQFNRATKKASKARIALEGPSGSGKTYTALTTARALGKTIALIDTEHRSASLYADEFDFDTLELDSYDPNLLMQALSTAATAAYEVVIVDSLSHFWMGADGMLEQVDRASKRSGGGNTFAGWKEMRPTERRMIDAMLAYPGHVIVTLRTKTEWVVEENERGKKVPRKIGLKAEQREGMEYEFTLVASMDQENTLVVTKSRCKALSGAVITKPGEEFGRTLLDWLDAGEATDETAAGLRDEALEPYATYDELRALYARAERAGLLGAPVVDGTGDGVALGDLVKRRGGELKRVVDGTTRVTAAEILGVAIEAPEPEAAAPAVPEQDDPVLDRQRKRMFALFVQEGYTNGDADAMRAFISRVIGREIASRKDMTGTEVAAVIDALEHPDAPESDAPEPAEGEAS